TLSRCTFHIFTDSAAALFAFFLLLFSFLIFFVFLLNRFLKLGKIYFLSCKIRSAKLLIFCSNGRGFFFFRSFGSGFGCRCFRGFWFFLRFFFLRLFCLGFWCSGSGLLFGRFRSFFLR